MSLPDAKHYIRMIGTGLDLVDLSPSQFVPLLIQAQRDALEAAARIVEDIKARTNREWDQSVDNARKIRALMPKEVTDGR